MKVTGIQTKAARVAQVFDFLAWAIIALGVLGVGLSGAAFLIALMGEGPPLPYLLSGVIIGIYAAVMWASVSLATIVAGYISNKQEELDRASGINMSGPTQPAVADWRQS